MAKRNKAGSIYPRPGSPFLWIKFYIPGETKPVRESTKTADLEEAQKYLHRRLGEMATGKFTGLAPERVKVSELFDWVVEDYENNDRAGKPQLKSKLKCHLRPFFGGLKAVSVTGRQITTYIAKRKRDGAKNATINRELEILRRAFRLGFDGEIIPRPLKVPKLVEDNVREGIVSHDQYVILRDGLREPYRTLFVCGYHLGTRLGELSKIEWSQVDFARNEIVLRRYTTKTKEPRTLPIYGQMREFLLLAKQRRDQNQPSCPWVFTHNGRKDMHFTHTVWTKLVKALGVPEVRFHDLRRTAATNMLEAGFTEKEVMTITGHKTDSMLRRYHIVRRQRIQTIGEKMEEFYRNAEAGTKAGTHLTKEAVN